MYKSFIEKVNTLGKDSNIELTKKTVYKEDFLFELGEYKYYAYKDKYGVCVIRKDKNEEKKKVRIAKDLTIKDVNESNIEEYFAYPKELGEYKGEKVIIKKGPYGLYSKINNKNISIPNDNVTLDEVIELLEKKNGKVIKEWKNIKILNGPYGPYIQKGSKRVSVPKDKDPAQLTAKECDEIVKNYKPSGYKFKKKYKKNT